MQTAGYTHEQSIAIGRFGGSVLAETELAATVGGHEIGREFTLANRDEFGEITCHESVVFTDDGHALAVRDDACASVFELEPDLVTPFVPDDCLL